MRSIVKVNAGKEENVYRGRVKGETEKKGTQKELDNEGKVLKYPQKPDKKGYKKRNLAKCNLFR